MAARAAGILGLGQVAERAGPKEEMGRHETSGPYLAEALVTLWREKRSGWGREQQRRCPSSHISVSRSHRANLISSGWVNRGVLQLANVRSEVSSLPSIHNPPARSLLPVLRFPSPSLSKAAPGRSLPQGMLPFPCAPSKPWSSTWGIKPFPTLAPADPEDNPRRGPSHSEGADPAQFGPQ